MSLGSMEGKTTVETADPHGTPKTLKPQFIYRNRLDKHNFNPSHLNLHNSLLKIPLFKAIFNKHIKLHMLYYMVLFFIIGFQH